jgi:hypothetical protein
VLELWLAVVVLVVPEGMEYTGAPFVSVVVTDCVELLFV